LNQPTDKRKSENRSVSLANRISPFVNNLMVRLVIAVLLAILAGQLSADFISDATLPFVTERTAAQIAATLRTGAKDSTLLEAFRKYGVMFCYTTTGASQKPDDLTEAYAGNFKILRPRTGRLIVGDSVFYHAMVQLPNEQTLHVGTAYRNQKSWLELFRNPLLFLISRGDDLHFGMVLLFVLFAVWFVCFFSVVRPASLLANLPFGDDDRERGPLLKRAKLGAAFEILHMYKSFMAYSKSVRSSQSRLSEFQRPLDSRSDDALLTRKSQSDFSDPGKSLTAPNEQSPAYRLLENTLDTCATLKEFRDELMNGLSHTDLKYCVLLQQGGDAVVAATSYVDHRALQLLSRIDHKVILKLISETNRSMDIGAMSLRRYGFGMLSDLMNLKTVHYAPIKFHGSLIGALIVFFDAQMAEKFSGALIDLDSFCSRIGGPMSHLLKKQELEDAGLKDQLTGLPNRKFLQDYLSERLTIAARTMFRDPLSLFIIQPNINEAAIASHGEALRDKILQDVAGELQRGLKETFDSNVNFQLVRYDVEEFAICVQPLDENAGLELGRSLQSRILKSKASVGDLFGVTLTVGLATSPSDARDERSLLSRAKLAMRFAEEFKFEERIAAAREVPVSYEPSKRLADISGELGVLDCAALLQSIANSQKTGVLTVEDELGRQYQSLFKTGKLLSSVLEGFHGMDAVIEFVTSFEAGRYNFKLVTDSELEKIAAGEVAPHLPLDKCLMEAALAEDHLKKAKRNLHETFLLRATPGEDAKRMWSNIENDTKQFSSIERHTMKRILALSDGSRTLANIFTELQFAPTYLKWHAAAILTDNRLLQTKKGH
jgi:diguanylate cyclase (GGDEF)-like protein